MPQALVGEHIPARPTPLQRRIQLRTLRDVRKEMSRVYTECRRGSLNIADGSKLTYMLSQLSKAIADHDLEARIAALEARS